MTKPFTSARAVPYSSVVGGGIMLLDEKGACVAQLAIMAGDKERSDAVSDELMKRLHSPRIEDVQRAFIYLREARPAGYEAAITKAEEILETALNEARK